MEKLYAVEFMQDAYCFNDTISDNNEDASKKEYLYIGTDPIFIKESDLVKYMKYGNGFKFIKFVGNILE